MSIKREYVNKIPAAVLVLAIIAVAGVIFYQSKTLFGATYTFTQTDWSGGTATSTAVHPTNQNNWTYFNTASSGLKTSAAGEVSLETSTSSVVQTTDADFNSGTVSQTTVANDSVALALTETTDWVKTTVDSTGNVGADTSLSLGSDGFARISYYDSTNADLKFVQCTNADCTLKNITTVDSAGTVGWYTSIALGSDDFARISYYDSTNADLKFVQCTNADCTTKNITTVDSTGNVGYYTSIALGSDGFARISYWYETNENLKFVQCTNADCTTKNITTVDSTGYVGYYTSIALGSDGFARISYWFFNDNLKFVQCTNADCSTKNITTVDSTGNVGAYTSLSLDSDGFARISYYDKTNDDLKFTRQYPTYYSSGSFQSNSIDTGQPNASWGNLSWTASGTGTITIKARTDADGNFSDASAWGTCSDITNGSAVSTGGCATNGHRYIQYQATLSTSDTSVTPSLDDVTIGYNYYPASQTLVSSPFDSTDAANVMGSINWDENATLPAGTTVTVSLRTASSSADLASAIWSDFTYATANCAKVSASVSCPNLALPSALKDGVNDRWFQYKITLTSSGANTPTVSEVRIQYVVNAPPEFDASFGTNGVSAVQIATSTDPNWAKVQIQYSIRDPDTNTGTQTPGYITPSFEYNTGSGWTSITSQYLASGNLDNKAVATSTYNIYTAFWDAQSQISGAYTASAQVRVTINDNEAANNTAQAISGNFVLDTKNPVIASLTVDSSADTLSLNISDDNNIDYRLSNVSDFSGAAWQAVGNISTSTTRSWTFTGAPSFETVYLGARDIYNNSASSASATAPSTPSNVDIKDTSNIQSNEYRQFISWSVYSATTTAPFANYKLYRSTNGTDYSLLTTISNVGLNYYTDNNVASSTTYYYKLTIIDTDSDISNYSTILSDLPDGQGGTDFTPPTISSVQATEIQATWAKIIWTTDEISNSTVEFSTTAANNYASSTASVSLVTSHEVVISDLTPNTAYIYRVKSVDILNNETTNNNNGAGYTFTTEGGPIISDVTVESVADQSATVIWNTNEDSNSYAVYSTNQNNCQNNTNTTEVGNASLVGGSSPYQHRVTITGLTQRTIYYYYVKSTDSDSNIANDKNDGSCYSFTTTYDTKAPVISNISAPVITDTVIVVLWQTDELADSQVEYGTATSTYTHSTTLNSTLSISHANTLSSLTAQTKYYFRVKSNDAQGNLSVSSEQSATTNAAGTITIIQAGGGGGTAPDTTAPTISNINISDIGAFEATISFNTNEISTGYVLYGKDSNYGATAASAELKTQHKIKLSGLKLGTEYHFQVKAQDKSGNFSAAADQTFTTKFAAEALGELTTLENAAQFQEQLEGVIESVMPSLVPPFISKVDVDEITEDSAMIKWRTNVSSYGSVAYASDTEYNAEQENPYAIEISQAGGKDREHSVELIGLSPGTLYHFQAKSFVFSGVIGKSKNITFYTKISKVKPEIVKLGNTQLEIRWMTDSETSSFVEYHDLRTGKISRTGDSEKIKTHSIRLENLVPDNPYEIRVFGYDVNNNIIEGNPIAVRTKKDVAAPEISSIKIDNALLPGRTDRLQTVVSWRTDEPANSLVYFEEGIGVEDVIANKVGQDKEFTTDHIVIITTLRPSKIYRIKIVSLDESDNLASSPIRTILTPRSAESVFDIISRNLQETFGFLKNLRD